LVNGRGITLIAGAQNNSETVCYDLYGFNPFTVFGNKVLKSP